MQKITKEELFIEHKRLIDKCSKHRITNWSSPITCEQLEYAINDKSEEIKESEDFNKIAKKYNSENPSDSLDYIGPQIIWLPILFRYSETFNHHDIIDKILDKRANTNNAVFDWLELIKSPHCPEKYIVEYYYSRYNNRSKISAQILELIVCHKNAPPYIKKEIKGTMNNKTSNLVSDEIVNNFSIIVSYLIVMLGFFTIFSIVGVGSHPLFVIGIYLAFYLLFSIAFHPLVKSFTRKALEKYWSTALSAFETLRKNGHR